MEDQKEINKEVEEMLKAPLKEEKSNITVSFKKAEPKIEEDPTGKTEAQKKALFVKEYNELVIKHGYDYLIKLAPPELVKVEFIKNEKI
jgi:hypothetical protein